MGESKAHSPFWYQFKDNKYTHDDHELDEAISKLIQENPSGLAYKIYETVPQVFEFIFGVMVLFSLYLLSRILWQWILAHL
ncbi:MAG: hypothetical protein A2Z38_11000 [Planctomycetes bacterium RBG_19FT_COMBO_48_8]|nr:MAG: hypothetical protein A2Z38_11000 [Planctomycetes bacterium RBG_19FT_COMBO_48_8]